MDDKYSFRDSMSPAPVGITEHLGMMEIFSVAISGVKHKLTHFINEADWIAVYGTVSAKHFGNINGVSATAKKILITWMHMFHIVNGKVVDAYFEMNPMSIMSQINTDVV